MNKTIHENNIYTNVEIYIFIMVLSFDVVFCYTKKWLYTTTNARLWKIEVAEC